MSFRSVLTGIKQWYNDLNPATLTGAIDVIVVEQDDGTFVSSPFHVRFGKMGVLKAKEKIVSQQFFLILIMPKISFLEKRLCLFSCH